MKRLRDYIVLVLMCQSRWDHVREPARLAVKRDGWRIRPCSGRKWIACYEERMGVVWLWYNIGPDTHTVQWADPKLRGETLGV